MSLPPEQTLQVEDAEEGDELLNIFCGHEYAAFFVDVTTDVAI
jgi:hypothetical protein